VCRSASNNYGEPYQFFEEFPLLLTEEKAPHLVLLFTRNGIECGDPLSRNVVVCGAIPWLCEFTPTTSPLPLGVFLPFLPSDGNRLPQQIPLLLHFSPSLGTVFNNRLLIGHSPRLLHRRKYPKTVWHLHQRQCW